jgi:hypothetical protein
MLHFQIMHVVVILIVAFFVFFAAQKADGLVSLFGNLLGALLLVGAALHIAAIFVPGLAMKHGMGHDGMMGGRWHHCEVQPAAATAAPAAAPAPAKPSLAPPAQATPAPKKP